MLYRSKSILLEIVSMLNRIDRQTLNYVLVAENSFMVGRVRFQIQINGDREDLPAVWIDAGIDPRVWLSSSSAVYIAFQVRTLYMYLFSLSIFSD